MLSKFLYRHNVHNLIIKIYLNFINLFLHYLNFNSNFTQSLKNVRCSIWTFVLKNLDFWVFAASEFYMKTKHFYFLKFYNLNCFVDVIALKKLSETF